MTPAEFISKWRAVDLKERTASQSHFNDICRLLDIEDPITGIIVSRDQRADLAVRRKDGKCFSYVIELEQKHQGGGSYGRTVMASGRDLEMLCSNVGG